MCPAPLGEKRACWNDKNNRESGRKRKTEAAAGMSQGYRIFRALGRTL